VMTMVVRRLSPGFRSAAATTPRARAFHATASAQARVPMIKFRYGAGRDTAHSHVTEVTAEPPTVVPAAFGTLQEFGEAAVASKNATPHVFMDQTVVADDMLEVMDVLKSKGKDVCVTDLLLRAAHGALREVPAANAAWNGMKVPLPETRVSLTLRDARGVVTTTTGPANDEGSLQITSLADWRASVAAGAAGGHTTSYTAVSVVHPVGGTMEADAFRSVVGTNHSAVLSFGALRPHVGVSEVYEEEIDGEMVEKVVPVAQTVVKVSLSADGRVMDGYLASEFLSAVCDQLGAGKLLDA